MSQKLTRNYLEFQADQIEAVLASHRVPARVHGAAISPRWMSFHITAAPGARISIVRNLSEELALALGAKNVRIARDGGTLAVEVPRPDAEPVNLVRMLRQLKHMPPMTACLGLAEDGRPLLIRLPSPDVAHVLVAGSTGSGKTELIRTALWSLAIANRQAQLQMILIDPKRRGFGPLSELPHLMTPPVSSVSDSIALLQRVVEEMERRDQEEITSPHIVVAIDEAMDLLMTGGREVDTLLTRIAQRGREAGIHLLVGAQNPSSSVFSSLLKANFPVRLVGRVSSANDARVAAGISGTHAEKLLGRGDFVAVAAGETTRFQAAFIPRNDLSILRSSILQRQPLIGTEETT